MRRNWYSDPTRSIYQYKSLREMLWHIGMVCALWALILGIVFVATIVNAFTPGRRDNGRYPPSSRPTREEPLASMP